MKVIKLVSASFENFKKLNWTIEFGEKKTQIFAMNRTGKSSMADGIFWVLFGKSSTGKSEGKEFRPRPYDSQGVDIDHVDVVAELVLLVDGVEVVLRKTQRQNWVRKRGTTTEVHEGDKNIYAWNNVEISETEFKRRIADIVSEKNFMLITDPTAFFRLSKQEKLDLILSLIANVTEEQILMEVGGFDELLKFVRDGKKLEEVKATSKRSISDMTKERDQISAFINERSKDIVDMDVSDIELQRNAINEKIAEIDRKIEDSTAAVTEYDEKSKNIIELKMKKSETERIANESLVQQKRDIQKRIDEAEDDLRKAIQHQKIGELEIQRLNRIVESNKTLRAELAKKVETEEAKTFSEYVEPEPLSSDALVCPTCGQDLPEELKQRKIECFEKDKKLHWEKYEADKGKFEADQSELLDKICQEGKACVEKINKAKEDLETAKNFLESAKADKITANADKTKAMEELAALPEQVDLSNNQEYEALCMEIQAKEEALRNMNTGADYRTQLRDEKTEWETQLAEVNQKFAAVDKSDEAKDRVAELEKQFKDKVQLIADQERILMMCEEFQTAKDNYLTEEVNKHFENVRFQLFRQQKNGGVERVCDVYTKNGSPYGDNTTSGAEKLIMGLEVINVLSGIIGVKAPVIVDNAEKVSEGNMPEIDTQMIMLSVSNDEDFRIEKE
ncbi:AAA family ATPase [Enterocloster clostridioformis]|uniref:Phage-like protein n=1 Tax=Enterocloster clostridioformis TaxID=1531 RepID=A0A174NS90_9FIRM|nr:AAA family ATPase [Enterocloster clostridioformis]CUP51642.1 phage-like protein [Enterocloster clostridioformis]